MRMHAFLLFLSLFGSVVWLAGCSGGGGDPTIPGAGMTDIGTLGGADSCALAINNSGQVVGGWVTNSGAGDYHAFLWNPE